MTKLKPIFFAGTSSDVGKSVIAAGFCRIFKQDGYAPAPFKAQNMSLNSFATPDGFEIGRAQAVQADAAGIPCTTDMNPVLLKPTGTMGSQIVLHGKPWKNQCAYEYFAQNGQDTLFEEVTGAFDRLKTKHNPIVMEGAGGIAEINLRHRDIVNMRMALHAGAAVYLIADIERGGVFASVYGTLALLQPEERKRVKGVIINKFRGDIRLFETGKTMLEELIKIPVVGILPKFDDIYIEPEDSLALQHKNNQGLVSGKINIAVVALSRLSNFTDFDLLEKQPDVNLFYTSEIADLEKAEIIILPGTKSTIPDLIELKNKGLSEVIVSAAQQGKTVVGICGGYQMMGLSVADPLHVESEIDKLEALGILPVTTVMTAEKTTRQVSFRFKNYTDKCTGYEIHMGVTECQSDSSLNIFEDGTSDGFKLSEQCWGSYVHGIFDNSLVINDLLKPYRKTAPSVETNFSDFKNEQFDRLADLLRQNLDIELIYKELTTND